MPAQQQNQQTAGAAGRRAVVPAMPLVPRNQNPQQQAHAQAPTMPSAMRPPANRAAPSHASLLRGGPSQAQPRPQAPLRPQATGTQQVQQAPPRPQATGMQQLQQGVAAMNLGQTPGGHVNHNTNTQAATGVLVPILNPNPPLVGGVATPSVGPWPQVTKSMITSTPRPWAGNQAPFGGTYVQSRCTINYGNISPQDRKKWFMNNVCIQSPYTRTEFERGMVISRPFHVANMNRHISPNDTALRATDFGPVFTKRRMFVILHRHIEGYFCLPLYSFQARGIAARRGKRGDPHDREIEYIPVKDVWHGNNFINHSHYYDTPITHVAFNQALTKDTVCHITGGVNVHWEEHLAKVGRLTKKGYDNLLKHWHTLNGNAELEATSSWPTEPAETV